MHRRETMGMMAAACSALLMAAVGGCGSAGHTIPAIPSAGSNQAVPASGVSDLETAIIRLETGGDSFIATSVSDDGLVAGYNAVDLYPGYGGPIGKNYILSPTSNVLYKLFDYDQVILARCGLALTTTSIFRTISTPYKQTAAVLTPGGGSVPLEFVADEDMGYPMASAVSKTVVGYGTTTPADNVVAILWTYTAQSGPSPSPKYIPRILQPSAGNGGAKAADINKAGFVVGSSGAASELGFSLGPTRATMWNPEGVPVDLGVLPGQSFSTAVAINDNNVVVGYSDTLAFVYTAASGMTALPPLPGDTESAAIGVTNSGDVIGTSYLVGQGNNLFGSHAVVWKNGVPSDLGVLFGIPPSTFEQYVVASTPTGRIILQTDTGIFLLTLP